MLARRAACRPAAFRLPKPEEARTRPVGPGDLLRDCRQRSPGLSAPREAGLENEHIMALALPFAHEPRAGLGLEGPRSCEVSSAVHRVGELGQAALHGRTD